MVIANFRCKDCQQRYPGCHDHCESYREDKAAHEQRKHDERLQKEATSYIYENVGKIYASQAKRRRDQAGYTRFSKGSG